MKPFRILIVLAVLANLALVGWLLLGRKPGGAPPSTVAEAVQPLLSNSAMEASRYDLSRRAGELSLIVISMDALRYDRTGFSGNSKGLTPNLDRFAEESVVFHDAVSAAPWTLPSHMSVWTGRWPSIHGVTNKLKLLSGDQLVPTSLSPAVETYPDLLIKQGFTAGGFTGGAGVQSVYGFGRGFDTYVDDRPFAGMDYSSPKAVAWLQAHLGQRVFLFLHGYDSHGQYELAGSPPRSQITSYTGSLDGTRKEQARLREQGLAAIHNPGDPADLTGTLSQADGAFLGEVYDRKVAAADQRLGDFLASLRAGGWLDRAIVVVMSDHGDEFMEHGAIDHGYTLYQEQLHTVLLMRFPGTARRQDVKETARLVDIFPTLFASLGLEGPPNSDGRSLLPLMRGQEEPEPRPIFSETDYRLFVNHRMVREGPWKLILDLQDGQRQLFDLRADPGEKKDRSSEEPRVTYEMEQTLRAWLATTRTNPQDYMGVKQKPIELF